MKSFSRFLSCSTTCAGARATKLSLASLALRFADFTDEAGDLLVESLHFNGWIDLDLQHQPGLADDGDWCTCLRG
jgi:hypothetical protein